MRNHAEHCTDTGRNKKYIFSNGVPPHDILIASNRPPLCQNKYKVVMPLRPRWRPRVEPIPSAGPIGFSLSGIPIYSAAWAVWNRFIYQEHAWMGHPGTLTSMWHYHHPASGNGGRTIYASEDTLVGYAMDGFPIFGPLRSRRPGQHLDECNGRWVGGEYQYHLRRYDEVDLTDPYCSGKVSHWNFVLGCYHGDLSESGIFRDNSDRSRLTCSVSHRTTGQSPPPSPPPTPSAVGRTADFVSPRGGSDGWCATGVAGSPAKTLWLLTEEECAAECVQDPRCHAYEHGRFQTNHRGHKWCQLQYASVTHVLRTSGFSCMVKAGLGL